MTILSSETLHATAIAIDGQAVLLEGASGVGKSDLALRLIDRGATLISDDYTLLVRSAGSLVARAPDTIRGRIEVRGLGILTLPVVQDVPVHLIVRLGEAPVRLPDRRIRRICGIAVREVVLDAMHISAPLKVEWALRQPEATPA
ncbi:MULTISPECIES: HPr kinase/phosphorylase [unclassified Sphingomonas]|jgi:serine kinase of HPr protein (carbohydrate metabolism regulator)|uniref:HPr kinase/phosphorylase n=1 Tax=unclassified Sphingomonas TaxID=196159 RepID=UPI000E10DEE5|nr:MULTISPECIES: HPr kinase/phosphatase C-terminal domain-containing protein [unclassified Sphingomonas]AXJ96575.1 aldolase [Sphingomonas sp. FARSPH]